jgi:hypothetical protein
MYPNPYIWFWFGYNLVWQNNRPCTPLVGRVKQNENEIKKNPTNVKQMKSNPMSTVGLGPTINMVFSLLIPAFFKTL